jgi:hypothetical protein
VAQADAAADALAWSLDGGERERLDRLALALPIRSRMPANPLQSA